MKPQLMTCYIVYDHMLFWLYSPLPRSFVDTVFDAGKAWQFHDVHALSRWRLRSFRYILNSAKSSKTPKNGAPSDMFGSHVVNRNYDWVYHVATLD